jgi:NitT/TauT family transport system substrate-binding protein
MHRVVVAVLAVFGLALAGAADAADKLVLQSKWLPQAQFAGYYVARGSR